MDELDSAGVGDITLELEELDALVNRIKAKGYHIRAYESTHRLLIGFREDFSFNLCFDGKISILDKPCS
jgi:hypothetical protein